MEQDSESGIFTDDEEASEPTQTFQTYNVVNETTHDEENPSETEDDISKKILCMKLNHI